MPTPKPAPTPDALDAFLAESPSTLQSPEVIADRLPKAARRLLDDARTLDGRAWSDAVMASDRHEDPRWDPKVEEAFRDRCGVFVGMDEHVRRSKEVEGLWLLQRGRTITFYVDWGQGRGGKVYSVTYFFWRGRAFMLNATSIFGLGRSKHAHLTNKAIRDAVYQYNWYFAHHFTGWQAGEQAV